MTPSLRIVRWSVERPCVFHEQSLRIDGDINWNGQFVCACCHNGIGWNDECEYELDIHGAYYPTYAMTPNPSDPPEPLEFHSGAVYFAGTNVEFPWALTEDEQL